MKHHRRMHLWSQHRAGKTLRLTARIAPWPRIGTPWQRVSVEVYLTPAEQAGTTGQA
jgi:hypothetical protein